VVERLIVALLRAALQLLLGVDSIKHLLVELIGLRGICNTSMWLAFAPTARYERRSEEVPGLW
jgi:hypothetical protein